MVYCNLPLQYIGFKYVLRAWEHFEKNDGTAFTSKIAGIDVTVWDEQGKDEIREKRMPPGMIQKETQSGITMRIITEPKYRKQGS